jgi:hypothetical protein
VAVADMAITHSMPETQESPPASAAYPGTPNYAALASSGLSLFRDIDHVRRLPQRAS